MRNLSPARPICDLCLLSKEIDLFCILKVEKQIKTFLKIGAVCTVVAVNSGNAALDICTVAGASFYSPQGAYISPARF